MILKKILEIIKVILLSKYKKCKAKINLKKQKEPELVDLGLPSGNLWMTHNMGASCETDYGHYYQFGSLVGYKGREAKKHSTWKTSPLNNGGEVFNEDYFLRNRKKWIYRNGMLKPENDIVTQTYGKEYKIPDSKDFQELLDYTIITSNHKFLSKKGILFTSKINGNTIFIPFSGYVSDGFFHGIGYFSNLWLSTRCCTDSLSALHMYCFDSNSCSINFSNQFNGMPIRGIKVKRD